MWMSYLLGGQASASAQLSVAELVDSPAHLSRGENETRGKVPQRSPDADILRRDTPSRLAVNFDLRCQLRASCLEIGALAPCSSGDTILRWER
ncbi:hypothetical protein MTO96_032332 [Rhipicephalus appendiculatus]